MNFFERQHAARGTTAKLVTLFTLAVLAIVAVLDLIVLYLLRDAPASSIVGWLIAASALSLGIIGGGMLTKTIALRSGGSAVALSVGAVAIDPTTSDPLQRRLVNVVEEMSIASGVPVPRLFVLEREAGINAFAAGYTPADAAITVTGGALHTLTRDELQGVIGHEFSHILNGDMRLNIRLIGLLNGILLLGLVGLRMTAFGSMSRSSDRRNNGAGPILLFAFAMMLLGFVGQVFASLIKAAVSRQREWLADASSVQFTRQTSGLAGALKKIAGLPEGSALADRHAASQVSHMLFGEGGRSFGQLFATHPPLLARIKALDPSFDARRLQQIDASRQSASPAGDAVSGLAAERPRTRVAVDPAYVTERVGTLTPEDLANGAELTSQLPEHTRTLAVQPGTAIPLVLALLLTGDDTADAAAVRAEQLSIIRARLDDATAQAVEHLTTEVDALAPQLRLPLLDLAAPRLVARPPDARATLLRLLDELALADRRVSLFEYCLTRLVSSYLYDAADPSGRSKTGRGQLVPAREAAGVLLGTLAYAGNDDAATAARALAAACEDLLPGSPARYQPAGDGWRTLDAAWAVLDALSPRDKQRLVRAMVVAVREDGVLTLHEAELLRTACRLLHCPVPAFVA